MILFYPQFVIILMLVFVTEVAVVVLGYIYRAKVSQSNTGLLDLLKCVYYEEEKKKKLN